MIYLSIHDLLIIYGDSLDNKALNPRVYARTIYI